MSDFTLNEDGLVVDEDSYTQDYEIEIEGISWNDGLNNLFDGAPDTGDAQSGETIWTFSQSGVQSDGDIIAAATLLPTEDSGSGSPQTGSSVETAPVVVGGGELASGDMTFTLTDTGGAGAGTQARAAFEAAAELWTYLLGDDININLDIGFSALNPGVLGQTGSEVVVVSYAAVRAALQSDAISAEDLSSSGALAAGSTLSFLTHDVNGNLITDNDGSANNTFLAVNTAVAKALGITNDANGQPINPASDGSVTFSSSFTWDFDPTDGITAGSQDFVGVAFHEIGHALGFTSGVDTIDQLHGSGPSAPFDTNGFAVFSVWDLFRYSSAGQLDWSYGGTPYFSLDGGTTNTALFSTGSFQGDGRQASHWKDNLGIGIMDPTANPAGNVNNPTNMDLIAFDVMGFDRVVDNLVFGDENAGTSDGSSLRDLIDGRAGDDTLRGFSGEDRLLGRQGDDFLNGGNDDDILDGGADDDVLLGGAGADLIDGGTNNAGGDTASYTNSDAAVDINLGADTATGGHATGDELNNIENLLGSAHNDNLVGDGNANVINGGGGNDTIDGGGGSDTMIGGTGNDTFISGAGADDMNGGSGLGDTADYSGSASGVDVGVDNAAVNLGGDAAGDSLLGIENLIGTAFDDVLTGNTTQNTIHGGDGDDTINVSSNNDTVFGEGGDDLIIGGRGADVLDGGTNTAVGDTVSYSNSDLRVTVDLDTGGGQGTATGSGHGAGDTLTNFENIFGSRFNDSLTGDSNANNINGYLGNDDIFGEGGADFLNGSVGNDNINGGTGNDTMAGGSGLDTFVFTDLGFGQDTINGWANGDDMLDFTALGLDENDFTITQDGADTLITLISDNSQTVRLSGISAATIDGNDFVDLPANPIMVPDSIESVDLPDDGGYLASDEVTAMNLPAEGGYLPENIETMGLPDLGGYLAGEQVASALPPEIGGYLPAEDLAEDNVGNDNNLDGASSDWFGPLGAAQEPAGDSGSASGLIFGNGDWTETDDLIDMAEDTEVSSGNALFQNSFSGLVDMDNIQSFEISVHIENDGFAY